MVERKKKLNFWGLFYYRVIAKSKEEIEKKKKVWVRTTTLGATSE